MLNTTGMWELMDELSLGLTGRLMALEGSCETTLLIPGISKRLKIFVGLWLILWFIDHHGVAIAISVVISHGDGILFLSYCRLGSLGKYLGRLY